MENRPIWKPCNRVTDETAKKYTVGLVFRVHFRATERHLAYGITHCYLPPDTGESAPP